MDTAFGETVISFDGDEEGSTRVDFSGGSGGSGGGGGSGGSGGGGGCSGGSGGSGGCGGCRGNAITSGDQ